MSNENLTRDPLSGAVLNKDTAGLDSYKMKRDAILRARQLEERTARLEESVQSIEKNQDKIIDLLSQMLRK